MQGHWNYAVWSHAIGEAMQHQGAEAFGNVQGLSVFIVLQYRAQRIVITEECPCGIKGWRAAQAAAADDAER